MQKEETSTLVQDILKMYMIRDSQSEPHYQHQNPAEHRIQDVKRMTSSIMDHVGCQAHWWLLCMTYVVGLLNHLKNSKGYIPKTVLTGETMDISPYLDYHFYRIIAAVRLLPRALSALNSCLVVKILPIS